MQFALGILSLQAQQREAAARTQQLREAQQQQAAIEQQRLQMAQVSQAQEARHQAFAESQAAQAEELNKQRLAFQVKEHEDMLKNQDAANLAKLGAGEDAFFRAGGPQPPPEALEGPEVEIEGVKKPSYRMSKIDLPGIGTFYHKIEDLATQQKFDEAGAKIQLERSRAVAAYQQGEYNKMRASRWEDTVKKYELDAARITNMQSHEVRLRLKEVRDKADEEIKQLERDQNINPNAERGDLIAKLRADPTTNSSPEDKERYFQWTAIDEAVRRKMEKDVRGQLGLEPPPKSITGQHPDEIANQTDLFQHIFGGARPPSPELQAQTMGNMARTVFITPTGTLSETPVPNSRRATLRAYYGPGGKVIGTDLTDTQGNVLKATGVSPHARAAARGEAYGPPAPAPAPPAQASPDVAARRRELTEKILSGKATPAEIDEAVRLVQ